MIEVFGTKVIARELEHGLQKTKGGIIIPDDNGKERGIRPRWCKVYKVGEDQHDVKPGQWILVEHGRWSYSFEQYTDEGEKDYFWYIDVDCIWAVSDEKPEMEDTVY